jgi:membrane-associated phospholipid phosphatase
VRPHRLLTTVIDEFRAINFPIPATITVLVLAAVFALFRRWLDLVVAAVVVALADGGNWLVNLLIHRPRPAGYGIVVDQHLTGYYSFPSGHVEHSLAFLGIVLFLSFQVRRPRPWLTPVLWVVRIILLALIVMQVPAAVLEGEHWPSDGLAALLWGGFWLLVGIQVYFWAARRWPRLVPANERREAVAHAT